jgi:hypothetical protein
MKPNWNDAPEWARWLACDEDGNWFWYEEKPEIKSDEYGWSVLDSVLFEYAGCTEAFICENWEEALEARPCDMK